MNDITKDLNRVLALSKVKHEARNTLNGHQLESYELILKKFDELRAYKHQRYYEQHKSRIAAARQRLIEHAEAMNKSYWRRWFGKKSVNNASIDTQAYEMVSGNQGNLRAKIDRLQTRKIDQFLDSCDFRRERREFDRYLNDRDDQRRGNTKSRKRER